jgi:signal transduction histidine kinase
MQDQAPQTPGFSSSGLPAGLPDTILAGAGLTASGSTLIGGSGIDRRRVEAVVETLAKLRGDGESLAEVAHDARNMVTALGLYCDLLEEPGVLTPAFHHYANELRLVATASRRLVEKLLALDSRLGSAAVLNRSALPGTEQSGAARQERKRHWDLMPAQPIDNLAVELRANRNLLAALAGPAITLTLDVEGGALPVRLTGEDLTRILVNLIKNAAEAIPEGGCIQLGLRECTMAAGARGLLLTVEDDGPGIPKKALDKIFESGYTTHSTGVFRHGGWPASHRGLGLSITRSIVEAAGGGIRVMNRTLAGARFEIELPVRAL